MAFVLAHYLPPLLAPPSWTTHFADPPTLSGVGWQPYRERKIGASVTTGSLNWRAVVLGKVSSGSANPDPPTASCTERAIQVDWRGTGGVGRNGGRRTPVPLSGWLLTGSGERKSGLALRLANSHLDNGTGADKFGGVGSETLRVCAFGRGNPCHQGNAPRVGVAVTGEIAWGRTRVRVPPRGDRKASPLPVRDRPPPTPARGDN